MVKFHKTNIKNKCKLYIYLIVVKKRKEQILDNIGYND